MANRAGKNLILSFVSLLFTLSLIEIGLRIYYHNHPRLFEKPEELSPTPDYSLELVTSSGTTILGPGWLRLALHPHITYKNAPDQHNDLFNINALGFRGEEVSPEKGNDVFRIIALGGSATFGLGSSSDAGTWTYQLQQNLNDSHRFSKRVEIINAGVIGYNVLQEFLYLATELMDLSPDLIIAYDGWNDFYGDILSTEGCSKPLDKSEFSYDNFFPEIKTLLIAHAEEQTEGFFYRALDVLKPLVLKTALGKFLRERFWSLQGRSVRADARRANHSRVKLQNGTDYKMDSSCVQDTIKQYQTDLARMAQFLSANHNVRLLIAVQPEVGWKQPWSKEETEVNEAFSESFPNYHKSAQIIYPQVVEAAKQVAAANNALFVDLSAIFEDRPETIFVDVVHINDHGNGIVAQVLSDFLIERIID